MLERDRQVRDGVRSRHHEEQAVVGTHPVGRAGQVRLRQTHRAGLRRCRILTIHKYQVFIQVKESDEEARISIFKVHTKGMPLGSDVDIKKLAKNTEGYVGADIESICREAAMLALRDNIKASEIPRYAFSSKQRKRLAL